jgi:hypothetical protein
VELILDKTITDYLRFGDENTKSFLDSPPEIFKLIVKVDGLLRLILSDTKNSEVIPKFLHMNSYFSFMAAVRLAISGHVNAVFPTIRSSLESACYGFICARDTSNISIWVNRDQSTSHKAICRKTFTPAVKNTAAIIRNEEVKSGGDGEMARYISGLYEESINFGAHPNPKSVFKHLKMQDDDESDYWKLNFHCLYSENSHEVRLALFTCAEYGLANAYIISESQPLNAENNLTAQIQLVNDYKNKVAVELFDLAG